MATVIASIGSGATAATVRFPLDDDLKPLWNAGRQELSLLLQLQRDIAKAAKPGPAVRGVIRFKERVMYQLPDTNEVDLVVDWLDAAGAPATVENSNWDIASQAPALGATNDDGTPKVVAEIGVNPDGSPKLVGKYPGTLQVRVTGDADLGAGVVQIVALGDVEVVAGMASVGTIAFGESRPQEPA